MRRFLNSADTSPLKTPAPPPTGALIGYARVSTLEQNLDMQIEALAAAGVPRSHIFTDKVSGVATRRPGRDGAIRQARRGDTIIVWKLDRISRSVLDLLKLLERLDRDGIGFRSLTDPIDTTSPIGRAILTIIGAVAQLERDLIAERTRAGVQRAKERGVKFGQPTKLTPEVRAQIDDMLRAGLEISEIRKKLKIGDATIRRVYRGALLQKLRAEGARRKS